jgi:exodeoxyribonuclease VII small subunit
MIAPVSPRKKPANKSSLSSIPLAFAGMSGVKVARISSRAKDVPARELTMAEALHADVQRLPFERAIEELESIVKRLEEGKVPLEESVAIYERGEALKRRCQELLDQAEARVNKIVLDSSGKPTAAEALDVG